MDNKTFSRVEIKSEDKGQVSAVFSTFNVVDKDGDITLPGAFVNGAPVVISAYGHKSWEGALPVGDGTIRTNGKEAILQGQFYLDTAHGQDAFTTVKRLAAKGLGEWSYGYTVLEADYGELDGRQVRYLKSLAVDEVSPVLVGAGVNTRTLATKGRSPDELSGGARMGYQYKAAIKPHDTKVTSGSWDAAAVVKAISADASVSDLRSVFAWVDSNADPETKSSYKFPHHTSVDGPANIRACIMGIAALNGARGGASIPEEDRKGVYNHLAQHLRDADREPPELRSGSSDGLKFNDELSLVLCELDSLLDRAAEVVALRAKKGRSPLSVGSAELAEWLAEDLRRLNVLLTPTDDEAAVEYLRFMASIHGEQS